MCDRLTATYDVLALDGSDLGSNLTSTHAVPCILEMIELLTHIIDCLLSFLIIILLRIVCAINTKSL